MFPKCERKHVRNNHSNPLLTIIRPDYIQHVKRMMYLENTEACALPTVSLKTYMGSDLSNSATQIDGQIQGSS